MFMIRSIRRRLHVAKRRRTATTFPQILYSVMYMQISDGETQKLIQEATRSLNTSHKRNPMNLRFGASVMTLKGSVYSSSAYWSDTLTLALHAEQAALAHAASHGERDIVAGCCVSTADDKGEIFCHP